MKEQADRAARYKCLYGPPKEVMGVKSILHCDLLNGLPAYVLEGAGRAAF